MKQNKSIILATVLAITGIGVLASCGGGGDTDGGAASGDSGNGNQFVSDGGSGSTLRIELDDATEIPTAGKVGFHVYATDPNGGPLSFIRVNCETEHGIGIIEPSSGGVAFETTNINGGFSGVLGGVTPGSFMIECRGPQGYNLVGRKHYKVVGEIPEGFDGFPGAAGGNLGGGVIVDPPAGEDVTVTQVTFASVAGDQGRVGNIDNSRVDDCDADITTVDPEPFGPDTYAITVNNQQDSRVFVESIQFEVDLGTTTISSVKELGGLVVQANSNADLVGVFTQQTAQSGASTADKHFAGTNTPTPSGTYNVIFTIKMTDANGESITVEQAATIIIQGFDNC